MMSFFIKNDEFCIKKEDLAVHARDLEEKQLSYDDRHEQALREAWAACEGYEIDLLAERAARAAAEKKQLVSVTERKAEDLRCEKKMNIVLKTRNCV